MLPQINKLILPFQGFDDLQIHFEELLEKLSAHRTDVSAKLLREIKKSLLLTCVKI